MAVFGQVGGFSVTTGDLAVYNSTGSTIAAGIAVKVASWSATTGINITPTTSDVGCIGLTTVSIPDLKTGLVRYAGAYEATASGTVTAGEVVMAGNLGVVLTQTAAKRQIGIALSTAATTEQVLILLGGGALNA